MRWFMAWFTVTAWDESIGTPGTEMMCHLYHDVGLPRRFYRRLIENRPDASRALTYGFLFEDAEPPHTPCALHMRATAHFLRKIAHRINLHLVAVLFAKESQRTLRQRLL